MKGKCPGTMTKSYRNSPVVKVDMGEDKTYEGTVRKVKNGKVCYYPKTEGPIESDYASGPRSSKHRY